MLVRTSERNIEAIISKDSLVEVYVTSSPGDDKKYILNVVKDLRKNSEVFASFFEYSHRPDAGITPSIDVSDDDFYIAFEYTSGLGIKEVFGDNSFNMNFEIRFELLKQILMSLDQLSDMPMPIILSISDADNILLDDANSAVFRFALKSEYLDSEFVQTADHGCRVLMENLARVIGIILEPELKLNDNSNLRIVHRSCEKNLYASIPELIYALYDSHESINSAKSGIIKRFMGKLPISKLVATAIFIAFLFISYRQFTKSRTEIQHSPVTAIGIITYSDDVQNENIYRFPDLPEADEDIDEPDFYLSPNSGVNYELYVVAPGDDISIICLTYYPDERFISVLDSFNGLNGREILPGEILRIPNLAQTLDILRLNP